MEVFCMLNKNKRLKKAISTILVSTMALQAVAMSVSATTHEKTEIEKNITTFTSYVSLDQISSNEAQVTRGDLAKIICDALGLYKKAGVTTEFSDLDPENPYYAPIQTLSSHGLMSGYEDGTCGVGNTVSYAEAITMIFKSLGYMTTATEGHWAGYYTEMASTFVGGLSYDYDEILNFNQLHSILNKIFKADSASLNADTATQPTPSDNERKPIIISIPQYENATAAIVSQKLADFNLLVETARAKGIDVKREEAVSFFAEHYINAAIWDGENPELTKLFFDKWGVSSSNSQHLSENLMGFELNEVSVMLETATETLNKVISGEYSRETVPEIDWFNLRVDGGNYKDDEQIVFPYNYTWVVNSTGFEEDTFDYVGGWYRGYATLNSAFNAADGSINETALASLKTPENQLSTFMLGHNVQPDFLLEAYPEEFENASLFVHYDRNSEIIRDYWSKALELIVPVNLDSNLDSGYILFNEPNWYSLEGSYYTNGSECYAISEFTLNKFRESLKVTYGDNISSLNDNWGTEFADFSSVEITLPLPKEIEGTPMYYDYIQFHNADCLEFIEFFKDEIQKHDPDALTSVKIVPGFFISEDRSSGLDFELITELCEIIGDDAGSQGRISNTDPGQEFWEDDYYYNWQQMAMPYDFMWSVSPEKSHVNTESHFLRRNNYGNLYMTPEYVRLNYWFAALLGLDGNTTWVWYRNEDGSIRSQYHNNGHASIAYSVSQQPQVANEVAQVGFEMNTFAEEVVGFQEQRKPIRIFHSETSCIVNPEHITAELDLYEQVYFNGYGVGFTTERIINSQDNSQWDVILVSNTEYVTDAEFSALQSYLDNGGTIVMDEVSLKYNEYSKARSESLSESSGKIVVVQSGDLLKMEEEALLAIAETGNAVKIQVTENNGAATDATVWRVLEGKDDNTFVLNLLNLGKTASNISLSTSEGEILTIKNMFTGEMLNSTELVLPLEGVELLEITVG